MSRTTLAMAPANSGSAGRVAAMPRAGDHASVVKVSLIGEATEEDHERMG
jgi:hypothetical protein